MNAMNSDDDWLSRQTWIPIGLVMIAVIIITWVVARPKHLSVDQAPTMQKAEAQQVGEPTVTEPSQAAVKSENGNAGVPTPSERSISTGSGFKPMELRVGGLHLGMSVQEAASSMAAAGHNLPFDCTPWKDGRMTCSTDRLLKDHEWNMFTVSDEGTLEGITAYFPVELSPYLKSDITKELGKPFDEYFKSCYWLSGDRAYRLTLTSDVRVSSTEYMGVESLRKNW